MSKKHIKQANEILAKTQASVLERIENYRVQIKNVSERELAKSLIPVHDHKAGTVTGGGIEDVPYGKLNPRGVDKSESGLSPGGAATEMAMSEDKMKAVKCMKCGEAHESVKKCGEMVKAKKSELIDAKGEKSSNSVVTPMPKKSIKQTGDKGGIVLPGAHLKKNLAKALTAGMGSGAPSTKVNELGKASMNPPTAKPPSGKMGATAAPPMSKPGNMHMKSENDLEKGKKVTVNTNGVHDGDNWHPKGSPKADKVLMDRSRTKPGNVDMKGTHVGDNWYPAGHSKSKIKKEEGLEKGVFGDAIKQSHVPHPGNAAPKVTLPGAGAQAGRAQEFGAALGGAFTPKAPVVSGLELASKPKPALGLASPKAAGITPKAPAAAPKKPGIFGKLFGKS